MLSGSRRTSLWRKTTARTVENIQTRILQATATATTISRGAFAQRQASFPSGWPNNLTMLLLMQYSRNQVIQKFKNLSCSIFRFSHKMFESIQRLRHLCLPKPLQGFHHKLKSLSPFLYSSESFFLLQLLYINIESF